MLHTSFLSVRNDENEFDASQQDESLFYKYMFYKSAATKTPAFLWELIICIMANQELFYTLYSTVDSHLSTHTFWLYSVWMTTSQYLLAQFSISHSQVHTSVDDQILVGQVNPKSHLPSWTSKLCGSVRSIRQPHFYLYGMMTYDLRSVTRI